MRTEKEKGNAAKHIFAATLAVASNFEWEYFHLVLMYDSGGWYLLGTTF